MVLSILLLVFLLSVMAFQAMHGMFSALIMLVLTVCCAALAMGTYEWIAIHWLMDLWHADYARPLALGLTFGVPLLALRILMDQTIKRTSLLPSIVDRGGGAVCGLFTGLIVVGISSLVLQMIPFDRGIVLGYSRTTFNDWRIDEAKPDIDPIPSDPYEETEMFPYADSFVDGLISLLSDGVFSAEVGFRQDHPLYVQAVAWANAAPMEIQRLAPPDSISVVETALLDKLYRGAPATRRRASAYEEVQPKGGHLFRRIKVELAPEARIKHKGNYFSLRQFRLVGRDRRGGPPTHYFAIGLQSQDDKTNYISEVAHPWGNWPVIDMVYAVDESTNQIDLIYELPRDFQPDYIEYKIAARAEVRFAIIEEEQSTPTFGSPRASADPTSAGFGSPASSSSSTTSASRGGNVRAATVRVGASHFGDKMPLKMVSYRRLKNPDIRNGRMADGHLVGYLVDQTSGKDAPVSSFDVPRDKRLLHLNVKNLRARSTFGKALASAVKSSQNYTVEDDSGKRYRLVGKYAVARVGGDEVVEIQYFSHQVGSIGGVGKFDKIQDRHMTRGYELVLLFLVDPGVKIVGFSTGGSASRGDDLRTEGLTAPP